MGRTAKVSLYCPKMAITFDGLRHWRTALEPMTLTLTFDDGSVISFEVDIPPTLVTDHILKFPQIATVAACVGSGKDSAGNSFVVNLPEEPVVIEKVNGQLCIVAKAIVAPCWFTVASGQVWAGNVTFGDCVTNLFAGGASALTATGTVAL